MNEQQIAYLAIVMSGLAMIGGYTALCLYLGYRLGKPSTARQRPQPNAYAHRPGAPEPPQVKPQKALTTVEVSHETTAKKETKPAMDPMEAGGPIERQQWVG